MPNALITSYLESHLMTEPKLFISHAALDEPLAKLFRKTLIAGGVPNGRVFYSSARSTGIPAGKGVVEHLRRQLSEAALVLELISPTFITRPMCLMELGAAWVLEKETFPVVVPALTLKEATDAIGNFQAYQLDDSDTSLWSELYDRIVLAMQLSLSASAWNEAVQNFAEDLPRITSAVPPPPATGNGSTPSPGNSVDIDDERFSIANAIVVNGRLYAEATNLDNTSHTASFSATFYGKDGSIAGVDNAFAMDVLPGKTKTLTFMTVPDHTRFKIDADSIL